MHSRLPSGWGETVVRSVTISLARATIATGIVLSCAIGANVRGQSVDVNAAMRDPAVQAAVNICRADRDRLCAWVMPGGGRIVRCLAAKPDQLSPDCRAAMEQARGALIAAGVVTVDAAVTPPPAGQ